MAHHCSSGEGNRFGVPVLLVQSLMFDAAVPPRQHIVVPSARLEAVGRLRNDQRRPDKGVICYKRSVPSRDACR